VVNVILYTTVAAECWMLTTGSLVAMAGVLLAIIVLAALLCGWALALMGPEDVAEVVPAPRPAPAAERRTAPRHRAVPTA